jgi:hypothetical protein
VPGEDVDLPDMSEEEVAVVEVKHPRTGKITAFIEKDAAFAIFARQQEQFVKMIQGNHNSLEDEVRDGFKLMRNVVLGSQAGMLLLLIMAFATLALLIGGKTTVTTPDGSSIEMGPAASP